MREEKKMLKENDTFFTDKKRKWKDEKILIFNFSLEIKKNWSTERLFWNQDMK